MLVSRDIAGHDLVGAAADGGAYERIQRRLDALWQREAVAAAALRDAYDDSWQAISAYTQAVDSALGLIEVEVQIAAAAAAAHNAGDADAFAAAVEVELAAWRLYLERLQARAASKKGDARAEAENAIRELRRRRTALAQSLDEARAASGGEWRALRAAVAAAHDALIRAVDETSATFE
jgi:hypothetical protein